MWNILAEKAYWECEYLLQTGSDIKYIDDGWITASQNWLSKKDNIGVVGFTDLTRGGDADPKRLFTQSIVHRHHFLLFGWYYPPKLTNWYCDDWITFTYRMAGADYQLKHRIVNEGGNPRYTPKSTDNELVGNLINNEYCKIIYWRDLKPRVFKE
jgi:hypothetical protein